MITILYISELILGLRFSICINHVPDFDVMIMILHVSDLMHVREFYVKVTILNLRELDDMITIMHDANLMLQLQFQKLCNL